MQIDQMAGGERMSYLHLITEIMALVLEIYLVYTGAFFKSMGMATVVLLLWLTIALIPRSKR